MGKRASTQQVREIVGDVSESTLAAIVAIGATIEEVAEAYAWLKSDDAVAKELQHRCQGRVAVISDLLAADSPEDEDEPARTKPQ
jgi:two-component sensor histidine kinase